MAGDGNSKWNAMSDDQKKQTFDSLPEEQKQGQSYTEWIKAGYQNQYENWMPWIEDQYLKWFTDDNKASYATKDTLDKSKVTGISQVDTAQDSVNNAVGQQVGQGGILQPVGDMASKEGINRAERGGKDDSGSYATSVPGGESVSQGLSSAGGAAQNAGSSVASGVSGLMGGGGSQQQGNSK